jgi:heme-degrading monooxygenase HmoA
MYARMNTAFVKPGQMDEFIAIFTESQKVAHDHADARQGHHGTYLLVDREHNKVVSLALWETEEGMRASMTSSWNQALTQRAAATMVEPPQREFFEVAVTG